MCIQSTFVPQKVTQPYSSTSHNPTSTRPQHSYMPCHRKSTVVPMYRCRGPRFRVSTGVPCGNIDIPTPFDKQSLLALSPFVSPPQQEMPQRNLADPTRRNEYMRCLTHATMKARQLKQPLFTDNWSFEMIVRNRCHVQFLISLKEQVARGAVETVASSKQGTNIELLKMQQALKKSRTRRTSPPLCGNVDIREPLWMTIARYKIHASRTPGSKAMKSVSSVSKSACMKMTSRVES